MNSIGVVTAAIALFVIAALLYYQAGQQGMEHFMNPAPPSAGLPRPDVTQNNVPADLNKAPPAGTSTGNAPSTLQRPIGVPGAGVAPPTAMATREQMMDLENRLEVWLDAAAQLDNEQPGLLSAAQRQDMLRYQGRLADIRSQLGTGSITDFAIQVRKEQEELKQQNSQWQVGGEPSTEQLMSFGQHENPEAYLDKTAYAEFRGLFNAATSSLKSQSQPNPLLRVRLQQLQVIALDLSRAEKQYSPPPITYESARSFLRVMTRPDQPLPTLLALSPPAIALPPLASNPSDVIGALRDIQWRLTVTYNPADQALKQAVAATLQRLQSSPSPADVESARNQVLALQARTGPSAAPLDTVSGAPLQYDPSNLIARANTLCQQIREAFPHDATALGCPTKPVADTYEAETTINIICSRLRDSVPSVSPEQFNCPRRAV
jgi:hypothetical protein